jgi:hypothetical protein
MKTLTLKLPDDLAAHIEAEARARKMSETDVALDQLGRLLKPTETGANTLKDIEHLFGSVKGLPSDLSANKKKYLKATGYGLNRSR